MKARRMAWAAAAAAILLVGTACSANDDGGSNDGEVVIALVAPTSGFAANYGPEAAQGLEMAMEEAKNEAGGSKLKVIKVNEDVLDSSQTLERIKKAIESDGADILVGPVFGSNQQAVTAYVSQRGIPMFTTLGGDEGLAGKNSAFIWPGADSKTAAPLGTYAAEELGYKTLGTLTADYAYGQNAIGGITKAFEAAGGKVSQQQWVPLGTTDMLQYATAADKNVDGLAMWLVPSDAASFVREYRKLNVKVPLLMFQGIFDPTYQEVGNLLEGTIGLNEYNHLVDTPENAAFTKAYAEKYDGAIPNQTTAFTYIVGKNIVTGLEESKGDASVDALRKALGDRELDTLIGKAAYNADGIAASSRFVVKATKVGDRYEWEPIKTYENIGN